MMKTYAYWMICFVFLALVIGCGGGDSKNGQNGEAPTIESITPADQAEDVDTTTSIWIIFSKAMDQASVEEAFVLQTGAHMVAGTFAWDDTDMVFSPAGELLQGETYTVLVGTDALAADGTSLAEEFTSSFTTAFTVDIIEIVPAADATDVAVDTLIEVTFRGAMDPSPVEAAFSLSGPEGDLTGVFDWQEGDTVMTFDPDLDLMVASEYTVTIGTGARDADGNFLMAEFSSSFSTEKPAPEVLGPVVAAIPTWTWTAEGEVTAYRYQLDAEDGEWAEVEAGVTEYTPQAELTDGEHTLYVQAAYGDDNWSPSGSWTVLVGAVYEGDLYVTSSADIQNFTYLKISGNLTIEGSDLTSLAGLESLLVVGGTLYIGYNNNLASLSGLDNLTVVHGSVSFSGNGALANLYGLDALQKIGGSLSLSMANISSLEGLSGLAEIGGNLYVSQSYNLASFTGLERLAIIKGNLNINKNSLTDCTGLSNLETISGNLEVVSSTLESFSGLDGLKTIGGNLNIQTGGVGSMQGLGMLEEIGGDLSFSEASGTENLVGLTSLTTIGGSLSVLYSSAPSSFSGLESLETIGNQLNVQFASLGDPGNLTNLISIGGQMNFRDNGALTTLGNYPSLTTIGGNLSIIHNGLTTLGDLSALTTLGGDLSIAGNFSLPNCQAENLAAQLVAAGWTGTAEISDNDPAGVCP
jgi:hypothetical protein